MKNKTLFIASHEPNAGSLIVSMGVMQLLKSHLNNVAFFRPIIEKTPQEDSDIHFMLKHFEIEQAYETAYGFSVDEAQALIVNHRENELLETLLEKIRELERNYEFILIEGLSRENFNKSIEFNINTFIAKNLQIPYISVINAKNRTLQDIQLAINLESQSIESEHIKHVAMYVNRVDTPLHVELNASYKQRKVPCFFLEEIEELDSPTVGEIMHAIDATLLQGELKDLDRVISKSKIAGMNIENLLSRIEENEFVIVAGDRVDVILAVLSANYSKEFPSIAGILLTGDLVPNETTMKLFKSLASSTLPILSLQSDTFSSAMLVNVVKASIRPNRDRKVSLSLGNFMQNSDTSLIEQRISSKSTEVMTPMMFEYLLFERASLERKRIVLPESSDERILRAVEILTRRDVVDIILLGDEEEIYHKATIFGLDISKAKIINPSTCKELDSYTEYFYEIRKHKGLGYEVAKDAMSHANYFATMMVHVGDADAMVSGAIHTTQDTIRPALQIIKTSENISLVSSLFLMCMQTKVLVYADCAINQNPNAEQLAQIAIASAKSAELFGIEVRIAMLSYSTGSSGKGDEVNKVRKATQIVKELHPELLIEGPIQYDAAIDANVAFKKLPNSKVAGKATVFIFPDLNTGNNTYKAVQRSANAIAIGPVLQGLKKPVNDLSRGCEVADIVNTVLITAIQAQAN